MDLGQFNRVDKEVKNDVGSLTLILGPMFAGKTTYLLNEIRKHENENRNTNRDEGRDENRNNILVINHAIDNRYETDKISSHNKETYPCLKKSDLKDINAKELEGKQILVIDEGQFFPEIDEIVRKFVNEYNLHVIIAGLNGTFQQKIFDKSNLLNLIPFADNVILLKSKCYLCGQDAPFSKRIVSDDKEILVGNNNYQPCCRKCL